MKINFNQSLLNLDGTDLDLVTSGCPVCGRAAESRPATLRGMCSDALLSGYQDARGRFIEMTGEEAIRRHNLAMQIVNEDIVELSPEDLALIRDLVAKRFHTALLIAQVWKMLNPKEGE